MTSLGCDSEKLSGFHVSIFQLILLMKMQFFFGSMWLLHCSWFFFSFKSFLRGANKISYIHGSSLLSPTSMLHLKNAFVICFCFSLFQWFHKLWRVLCLHIVWRLSRKLLHLKMPSDLLARAHEDWYQVWLHYQPQLNVEDIHPLIAEAAVGANWKVVTLYMKNEI